MNLQEQLDAATRSAKQQIEVNHEALERQLDAADRILLRKAADAVVTMTPQIISDPT